jgi:MFS family permease
MDPRPSVLVAGGFLGGLGIGPVADKEGRRAALAAVTVPLAVGTLVSGFADSFAWMTLGRFITGVGVGASSQIVPLYLSEVSPPKLRCVLSHTGPHTTAFAW